MSKNIPDLNFDSRLNLSDFKFKSEEEERLHLEPTRIIFGGKSLSSPRSGVVDQFNPRNVIASDITRPLLVVASEVDPLRVDVSAGTVVNPNGTIVSLNSDIIEFELERTNVDDVIVVFLENEIIEENPTRTTKFGTVQKVRRAQSENKLRSTLLSTFNNSSFFSSERKENITAIAVITVVEGSSGPELQIDMTGNSFDFNRPWFSPVDVEHRASLGSGISTDQNPHALAFNDLSSGNLPFYSQIFTTGAVIAKDRDIKGLPGSACEETIVPARIQTDTTGDITKESRFGKPLAKYVLLSKIPTDVSSMYLTSHKSRKIAYDWVPGTRLIVIPDSDVFTEQATIRYNRVFSLELPETLTSNTISYQQPDETNELIISGGLSYDTITNPAIDFEGSGPIPRNFTVYLNGNGDLIKFPQIVQRTVLLDNIGSTFVPLDVNQFGPAPIGIGLADATAGPNLRVVIRIFGKDENNVTITEDLVFDSDWQQVVLPAKEDPNNLRKTLRIFDLITGFQIIERENDGSGSKIVVYVEAETGITSELNNLAQINTVQWNGLAIVDARDAREIVQYLPGVENRFEPAAYLEGPGGSNKQWSLTEDLKIPKYRDVTSGFQSATAATYSLFFTLDVQSGDTVEVQPGKITTAVTSAPNRSIGEFLIGATAEDTRNDFILTVNNSSFDSGLTAEANSGDATRVDLSHEVLGARGNKSVNISVNIPNAITKSGDPQNGYDAFGETFISHHVDKINTNLPDTATYNVTRIRGRYLSYALPINLRSVVYIQLHGVKPPFTNAQLRIRVAYETFDFEPWEVISNSGSTLYKIDKGQNISKIQVELFGELSGFSLYEADS